MAEYTLRDYQVVARDYLRGRDRAALLLDMGLGKTAASLSALEPRHLPALVIAPKKVAEEVWDVEQELWRPDLTLAKAVGSPAARAAALRSDADIVVISWDNMKDVLKVERRTPFRTLLLDELSGYKGRGVRWRTAHQIIKAHGIPHVWGLTGTPAPNGYLDLWPQIHLLDNGERLGKNITTYRSRYFYPGRQLPNGTIIEWHLRDEAEDRIKEKIEDICLAMATDGRVKLPETTYNKVPVHLPRPVRKVYAKFAEDLAIDLRDLFDGKVHTAADASTLSNRLQQITAGFVYEDAEYEDTGEVDEYGDPILTHINEGAVTRLHTAKVEAVREIVESPHVGGVLVFYRYIEEHALLREGLADLGVRDIKEPGVIKQWNAGKVPVLLAHPASAGHGLNLQHGGHTTVWTTLPWDLEHWEQANKRLARSGQQHPVVIHMLMVEGSVDELVAARLLEKAEVQNDLLAYLESPL